MTLRRILEAPIADLTFADVEALIAEEAEEGARIELKRALPANDPQGDRWMAGAKAFGNPARDGLAKEVVALANAYGGAVVIGVDETDDHPKRARGPDPVLIPRVVECAERMQQALDTVIDPPLTVLEVRGIEEPGDTGRGVMVIRTAASTRAPHGHGRPPNAYMRRGSRSEPMTMRDLQATLFETRSRGERVTAMLESRRLELYKLKERGLQSIIIFQEPYFQSGDAVWFRCTLVATENLQLRADDLSRQHVFLRPRPANHTAFGAGGFDNGWRPRLGGTENFDFTGRQFGRWFIGDQGVVDAYGFVLLDRFREVERIFPLQLFPPVAMQVIAIGERLRRLAKRPEVELVIECEFIIDGPANTMPIGHGSANATPVTEGSTRIGPYSLGDFASWKTTFEELERGIWHGLGLPIPDRITIDLERWLAETDPSL